MHMTIKHCGRNMHPPCLTGHRHLTVVIVKKALHNGRLAHPLSSQHRDPERRGIALLPPRPRWAAPPSLLSQTAGQCIQSGTWAAHSPDWSTESSVGHSTVPFTGKRPLRKRKVKQWERWQCQSRATQIKTFTLLCTIEIVSKQLYTLITEKTESVTQKNQ